MNEKNIPYTKKLLDNTVENLESLLEVLKQDKILKIVDDIVTTIKYCENLSKDTIEELKLTIRDNCVNQNEVAMVQGLINKKLTILGLQPVF